MISYSITEMLYEARCEEDNKQVEWCMDYLEKLRTLAMDKINEVTLYIMSNIEKYLYRTVEEKAAILNNSTFDYLDRNN